MRQTPTSGRRFLFGSEQYDQCPFAAILRLGLAIGQYLIPLDQPATDQLAENRSLLRGAQSLAVNDAQAALAGVQTFGEEFAEQGARFVAIQAVQIEFILNHPAPAAQVAQDALCHALAQVVGFVAAFEAILQADWGVQAVMECCPFVGQVLQRPRWRWRGAQFGAPRVGQWPGVGHCRPKGSEVFRVDQFQPRLSR